MPSPRLIAAFSGITIATLLAAGLLRFNLLSTPRFFRHESVIEGHRCYVMWSETWNRSRVSYVLFVPKMPHGLGMVASWGRPSPKPEKIQNDSVYTIPEGLFVNGERLDSRENGQVFALIHPRQAIPIELKADELALFSRRNIESLGTTSLWKDRVLPLLEKHGWDPNPFDQKGRLKKFESSGDRDRSTTRPSWPCRTASWNESGRSLFRLSFSPGRRLSGRRVAAAAAAG